jgi:ABC-type lipoprotein release transport system permease subunit
MLQNILKLSWRNIWRNKRRTFFTLLAIAVGVISIIFAKSYITGILNYSVDIMIKSQSGHVRIAHSEYLRFERIFPKEYLVPGMNRLQKEIAALPGIDSLRAQIKFNVLLSHEGSTEIGLAVGIEPEKMDKSMELSKTVVSGNYFGGSGLELVMGKKLAEKLKVSVGDELLLVTSDINYSTYALPFKIAGIFETGYSYFDKHILYIPIEKAREMLNCKDSAHEVLVFLKNPKQSRDIVEKIKNILTPQDPQGVIRVIPWQEDDMIGSLPIIKSIYGKIMGIVMLIVTLVILNTMLMSVMERYHEIGVIKAMGFKNSETFFMILIEAFYLGTIGSVIGGILGGSLSAFLEKTGIDFSKMSGGIMEKIDIPVPFFGKILYPDFTLEILINSIIFGIVIALIAVLYPAFKSAKMLPVEAFRSELKV